MRTSIFFWCKANVGEKHQCHHLCLLLLLLRKLLTIFYWYRLLSIHRHPPLEGYNLLSLSNTHWKGAPNPWSHLSVPTGREHLPPEKLYQLLRKGGFNSLTESANPQHLCGPNFIIFHIGPTLLKTSKPIDHLSLNF